MQVAIDTSVLIEAEKAGSFKLLTADGDFDRLGNRITLLKL
jgi:hypothetical protein